VCAEELRNLHVAGIGADVRIEQTTLGVRVGCAAVGEDLSGVQRANIRGSFRYSRC